MKKNGWVLVHKETKKPCEIGMELIDFRMNTAILKGGQPPHKPSSTGKVFVSEKTFDSVYFPSVYNLIWIKEEN